jgi:hypothetical protein
MHIIFPRLIVTQEQAVVMGKAIACKLHSLIGDVKELAKDWFDVVDSSVYLKNGLRMIGSRKCKKCTDCHGVAKTRCKNSKCIGGKVDLGKVYKLAWVMQQKKMFVDHPALTNVNTMVKACSIRAVGVTSTTKGWLRYFGCPTVDDSILRQTLASIDAVVNNQQITEENRLNRLELVNEKSQLDDGEKAQKRGLKIEVEKPSAIFKEVQQVVRDFSDVYKYVIVKGLYTNQGHHYYRACLIGEGSHVCQNLVAGEHKSNTIYMIIKPSGVTQQCWCNCNTTKNRIHGVCKNFQSSKKPLSDRSKVILFQMTKKRTLGLFKSPNDPEAFFFSKGYVENPDGVVMKRTKKF